MIKKILQTSIFITICLTFINCKTDSPPKRTKQKEKSLKEVTKPVEINKINFYFENSLSMNGYLNGDNFQQTVRRILNNSEKDSLNSYFVNTQEYSQSNIKERILKKNIRTPGVGNSDHKFIFTNAIKNATENNLSIVVTDGIYSMKDGKIAIVEIDIEDAFKSALEVNEIETVVLKMSSFFDGQYYCESCPVQGGKKITQERPYYILLFGNKKVINKALNEIVIVDDLEGYKEQARFFITKDLEVNYTVLIQGEEKKGSYRTSKPSNVVKEIIDAEKFEKNGMLLKDKYLQFGIALDFSNLAIPDSYLMDTLNYSIDGDTRYEIIEIKSVNNLNKASKTYKAIEKLNDKGAYKYTHILVVRAKTKLYGELEIDLDINFPNWIVETGTDSDCNIINDSTTTFAFDRLMKGISKAYEDVNDKDEYFELEINIKP